jgi:hypothetical protein
MYRVVFYDGTDCLFSRTNLSLAKEIAKKCGGIHQIYFIASFKKKERVKTFQDIYTTDILIFEDGIRHAV